MLRITVGLILLVAICTAIKMLLIPLLPALTIAKIRDLSISDLVKIFEVIIVLVVITGFILQELFHQVPRLLGKATVHPSTRWSDLLYVLTAAFGSASLYVGLGKYAGW